MGTPSSVLWLGVKHNGTSFHIDFGLKTWKHGEGFKGFKKNKGGSFENSIQSKRSGGFKGF